MKCEIPLYSIFHLPIVITFGFTVFMMVDREVYNSYYKSLVVFSIYHFILANICFPIKEEGEGIYISEGFALCYFTTIAVTQIYHLIIGLMSLIMIVTRGSDKPVDILLIVYLGYIVLYCLYIILFVNMYYIDNNTKLPKVYLNIGCIKIHIPDIKPRLGEIKISPQNKKPISNCIVQGSEPDCSRNYTTCSQCKACVCSLCMGKLLKKQCPQCKKDYTSTDSRDESLPV